MSRSPHPMRVAAAALAFGLIVTIVPPARGQSLLPLGRFIPADDLALYVEFDGLNAHAGAWRKTVAYKLLNETKLGVMLEDLGNQALGEILAQAPAGSFPKASETVDLLGAMAHDGFAFGVSAKGGRAQPPMVFVLRDASKNGALGIIRRLDAGSREVRRGSRVLHMTGEGDAASSWLIEGDDLIIAGPPAANVDAVVEAIDRKRPDVASSRPRADLARPDGAGFEPVLAAFVDFTKIPMPPDAAKAGLDGLKRIDLRWGFQADALRNVVRVVAPAPRRGVLALFDGPTFRIGQVPPIPKGVENFTVLALAPDVLYGKIVALASQGDPASGPKIAEAEGAIARALGARLKEDLLAKIGPLWVAYGGVEEGGLRAAIVTEARDPATLLEAFDRAVVLANAQIRAEAARNPKAAQGPVEIRKVEGASPGYQMILPAGAMPPGVAATTRPTLLVGNGRIALGLNEDEARAALETRPWTPSPDLAGPLGDVRGDLVLLSLSDPGTSVPDMVANTPTLLGVANNVFASIAQARIAAARAANRARGVPMPPLRQPMQLTIDPAKVPAAGAIRGPLFQGFMAVSVGDEGFTIVTRDAIPTVNPVVASAGLTALLLPAVQAAREAARRAQCTYNLKLIALALHNYHDVSGGLPAAAILGKDGKPLLSWRVAILPYVEQQDLYNQFHLDEPWDSPHNKALIAKMPSVYSCPSRNRPESGTTTYKVFVGGGAAFDPAKGVGFAAFSDGLSNTLAVVESKTAVVWTKPDDIPFDPKAPPSLLDAGSPHPGGFNALMSDGSVRFLKTINPKVFRDLITRSGGEIIPADAY